MIKKILGLGLLVLIIAIVAGYIIGQHSQSLQNSQEEVVEIAAPVSTTTSAGLVTWLTPTPTASLDLFSTASAREMAKYYKTGIFIDGAYKGGELVFVTAPPDGPGYDSQYYFVNQDGTITFLSKNSDDLYDGDSLDRTKFVIDDKASLSELIFPEKITYAGSNLSLQRNYYYKPFFSDVFDLANLKLAFVDAKLGNIYTDKPDNEAPTTILTQHGFYVRAPDGTLRTYSLDIYFHSQDHGVPQVTWSDGSINTTEYTYTDKGGCGSKNYASVISSLSLDDLVVTGQTSKGEPIYELKDKNSPILQEIYTNDYNPYDGPKISYDVFTQSKPAFFWFDSFGRLIKFQKAEFTPQAECGKPVIYLYPEKTTNVSVKINPLGGLTKSEPDYDSGWNIIAQPNGKLTEVKTGLVWPYLFWEGRGGLYSTPDKGFVVSAGDVHTFLLDKLTKLGLNETERQDFMAFWEPRMTGAPYFFVTFLGNKEMDALAPLTIVPKPDSVIRVLMDFSPIQSPIPVQGYDIRTPKRSGFTVVEWGGVLK